MWEICVKSIQFDISVNFHSQAALVVMKLVKILSVGFSLTGSPKNGFWAINWG